MRQQPPDPSKLPNDFERQKRRLPRAQGRPRLDGKTVDVGSDMARGPPRANPQSGQPRGAEASALLLLPEGPAHARRLDLEDHVPGAWCRIRELPELQLPVSEKHDALHVFLRGLRVRFLDRSRRPDYSPATC